MAVASASHTHGEHGPTACDQATSPVLRGRQPFSPRASLSHGQTQTPPPPLGIAGRDRATLAGSGKGLSAIHGYAFNIFGCTDSLKEKKHTETVTVEGSDVPSVYS